MIKFELEILPNELYDVFSDCFAHNHDSFGNDLKEHFGIASATACQEICNGNVDCNYFTYGSTIHSGDSSHKLAKGTLTSQTGDISGPKTCPSK